MFFCFLGCFTASLYLNNNILRNSIPTQLNQLTALIVLDLGKNQLTGQIPTQLGLLSDLGESITRLAANATGLATAIAIYILQFLTSFFLLLLADGLSLFDNLLTGPIPSELANLRQLKELYLDNTSLEPSLPAGLCDRQPQLNEFWADCEEIGGCPCCTTCCVDDLTCFPNIENDGPTVSNLRSYSNIIIAP